MDETDAHGAVFLRGNRTHTARSANSTAAMAVDELAKQGTLRRSLQDSGYSSAVDAAQRLAS